MPSLTSSHDRAARRRAWGISWLAYATYYAGRKGFGVAKKSLFDELGISEATLGLIDTLYLGAYAVGQFISGLLGDVVGARRLVGLGMLLSSGACIAFGSVTSAVMFAVFFFINGLAQSTGWPGTALSMAEWTTRQNRGTVMAFWATCYQVGGIAASWFAGTMLYWYGWRAAFIGPAIWIALVAVLVLGWLPRRPAADPGPDAPSQRVVNASGRTAVTQAAESSSRGLPESEPSRLARRAAQRAVFRDPLLWCYGGSYFFIKFIRYTLLFWLPFYLAQELGYREDHAAFVSTAFEAGGVVGVIVIGILSDRLRHHSRSALAAVSLVGLSLALAAYSWLGATSMLLNVLCLGLVGAFLFGPDALISGAASQDAGGPYAAATATGMVNGLGSIGAISEGLIVPQISARLGWGMLLPILVGLALLSALALWPTLHRAAPARG